MGAQHELCGLLGEALSRPVTEAELAPILIASDEDNAGDEMCDFCYRIVAEVAGTIDGKTYCADCEDTATEEQEEDQQA